MCANSKASSTAKAFIPLLETAFFFVFSYCYLLSWVKFRIIKTLLVKVKVTAATLSFLGRCRKDTTAVVKRFAKLMTISISKTNGKMSKALKDNSKRCS